LVRGMALQALGAAAERCDRTLAHVVGIERGNQRQAPTFLLRPWLVGGLGGCYRAHGATGAAADLARALILIGGVGGNTRRPRGRRRGAGRRGGGRRRDGPGRRWLQAWPRLRQIAFWLRALPCVWLPHPA